MGPASDRVATEVTLAGEGMARRIEARTERVQPPEAGAMRRWLMLPQAERCDGGNIPPNPAIQRAAPRRAADLGQVAGRVVYLDENRAEGSGPMRARTKIAVASYVAACLVMDLWPRFGPPEFRYTDSDLSVPVWNLGWPLALAVYDTRSGLHVGPLVYLILPSQVLALLAAMALIVAVRWATGTTRSSRPGRLDSVENA